MGKWIELGGKIKMSINAKKGELRKSGIEKNSDIQMNSRGKIRRMGKVLILQKKTFWIYWNWNNEDVEKALFECKVRLTWFVENVEEL